MIDHGVSSPTSALVEQWLTVPEVADQLGVDVTRVRQFLRERQLLAGRDEGVLRVPAAFVQEGKVLKGLPGTLTLLADSGFDDDASLRWLFTADESLPGTPAQALVENRGTEVRRRAQALAF
ncbi:MAG TPA: Rv2175c family DNA-binding protein [Actinomycetes bacterium]|nr:Rv2175c family DNA-binding protein [Actinomycetes bacterium]